MIGSFGSSWKCSNAVDPEVCEHNVVVDRLFDTKPSRCHLEEFFSVGDGGK